jgi:hypothetical protein
MGDLKIPPYVCSSNFKLPNQQVISVLQEGLDVDCVTFPVADTMVTNALRYVNAEIPPKIHELLGGELLDDDATEEVGTQ